MKSLVYERKGVGIINRHRFLKFEIRTLERCSAQTVFRWHHPVAAIISVLVGAITSVQAHTRPCIFKKIKLLKEKCKSVEGCFPAQFVSLMIL